MSEPRPLVGKLAAVMAAVGIVPKLGAMEIGGKKVPFVREVELLEAVRGELSKAGVMLFTSDESVETETVTREAKFGPRTSNIVTLRTKYTLIDAESGDEFSFFGSGQGEDSGDKALYKAKTGALKYALRETFLIPTGDDPENDVQSGNVRQRPAAPRPAQPAKPPAVKPPAGEAIEREAQLRASMANAAECGPEMSDELLAKARVDSFRAQAIGNETPAAQQYLKEQLVTKGYHSNADVKAALKTDALKGMVIGVMLDALPVKPIEP